MAQPPNWFSRFQGADLHAKHTHQIKFSASAISEGFVFLKLDKALLDKLDKALLDKALFTIYWHPRKSNHQDK